MKMQIKNKLLCAAAVLCLAASSTAMCLTFTACNDENEAVTVTDEDSLRAALLSSENTSITLNDEIVIDKQLNVAGKKTLKGTGKITMQLAAIDEQAILAVREDAELTVEGISLDGNGISNGVYVYSGAKLIYNGGNIDWTAEYGVVSESNATLSNVTMNKNLMTGLQAESGGDIVVSNLTITGTKQSAIHTSAGGKITISDSEITGLAVRPVEATGNSAITMNNVIVDGGHHGVFADGATITGSNVTVKNITLYGLVSTKEGASIELTDSTITKCGNAGARPENSGKIKLMSTTVKENECGLHAENGTVVLEDCEFIENGNTTATSRGGRSGAAMHISSGSTVTAKNCKFNNNTAQFRDGAGVTLTKGTIELENCEIIGNKQTAAGKNAGAIHVDNAEAVLRLKGCTIQGNETVGTGGAMFITNAQELTVEDTTIKDNKAGSATGSDVWINNVTATFKNVKFENSGSEDTCAIILENANSNLTLDGSTFTENLCVRLKNVTNVNLTGTIGTIKVEEDTNAAGKITVCEGYDVKNVVNFVPSTFEMNREIVKKGENVADSDWTAALANVKLPESDKNWSVGENGEITRQVTEEELAAESVAYITRNDKKVFYATLAAAVDAAQSGETIYVSKGANIEKIEITSQITIENKTLTILNKEGEDVVIYRNFQNDTMFRVNSGSLTIGSTDEAYTGSIVLDGNASAYDKTGGRTLRCGGGELTVGYNVTVQNASSNGSTAGAGLAATGGKVTLYCNFKNNATASGEGGGAILITGGGNVEICAGEYSGNNASRSGAITANGDATLKITGGVFHENTATNNYAIGNRSDAEAYNLTISGGTFQNNIYVCGTTSSINGGTFAEDAKLVFASGADVTVGGSIGTVKIEEAGAATITIGDNFDLNNKIYYTPASYVNETLIVNNADKLSGDVKSYVILPETTLGWYINNEGKLAANLSEDDLKIAYIEKSGVKTYYDSFADAFTAAADGDTIVVQNDDTINITLEVKDNKNITIINKADAGVKLARANGFEGTMFKVTSGSLTIGSTDASYKGIITIDGASAAAIAGRTVEATADFTLGRNATLANANSSNAGAALYIDGGNTVLYGNFVKNQASANSDTNGIGGAVGLNTTNKLTVLGGTYSENVAKKRGAAICAMVANATIEITDATFDKNSATDSHGGAISGYNNAAIYSLTVTNSTFTNNSAYHGGAIFNMGVTSTISISGCTFRDNRKKGQGADIAIKSGNANATIQEGLDVGQL